MRSLRGLTCLLGVVLLLALLVVESLAELPETREIKDKFMWGDPDSPVECKVLHGMGRCRSVALALWEPGFAPTHCKQSRREAARGDRASGLVSTCSSIEALVLWRACLCLRPPRSRD